MNHRMRTVARDFDSSALRTTVERMEASGNGAKNSATPLPSKSGDTADVTIGKPKKPEPVQKVSLRDLLHQTVRDNDVKELGEKLGEAQFKPEDVQEYVGLRRDINLLPGMSDDWAVQLWEDQVKVLTPLAKRSKGMAKTITAITKFHDNEFLKSTLEDVMRHFEVPMQTVENLLQFKAFLDKAAENNLVEVVENSGSDEDNITILADPGDTTNFNERTYLPKSKVARDAWVVVREKHQEMLEHWKDFKELRDRATPRLTPFKASDSPKDDKRGFRKGLSGNLFVLAASGNWAVLLNVINDTSNHKVASVVKYVGIDENDIASPNLTHWNHRRHSVDGFDKADIWAKIDTALGELNARQHQCAVAEAEKSKQAFNPLKDLATLPFEPKEQSLHKILDGEGGTITICRSFFSFRKKNGKIKKGYFGVAIKGDAGMPVVVNVAAAECFCFQKDLIGKKIPFTTQWKERQVRGVTIDVVQFSVDIKSFCKENEIRGRIGSDMFQSLFMVSRLLEKQLNDENAFAPDDVEDEEVDVDEEIDQAGAETQVEANAETKS